MRDTGRARAAAGDVVMIKGSNGTRLGPRRGVELRRFWQTGAGIARAQRRGAYAGKRELGMLYELVNFSDQIGALNVFRYITFRTGGAIFTALLFVMMFGPAIIDLLRVKQGKGQPIREDGPQSHHVEARHADDGRPDDPRRRHGFDAAVGATGRTATSGSFSA